MRSLVRFFDVCISYFLNCPHLFAPLCPHYVPLYFPKLFILFILVGGLLAVGSPSLHSLQGESLPVYPATNFQATSFQLVENFDGLLIGGLHGQNGWTAINSVNVTSDPVNTANRVVEVSGAASRSYKALNANTIDDTSTGTLYFRMRHSGDIDGFGGLSDNNQSSEWDAYQVQLGDQISSDEFVVRNGAKPQGAGTIFNPDTWYCVWLVANNATNSYQAYVQSASLPQTQLNASGQSNFAFRNVLRNNPLNAFLTRMGTENRTSLYLDDIYIDPTNANLTDPVNLCSASVAPPSANFDATPQIGDAPLTVALHIINTANITSCVWEYGDGTTGSSCDSLHNHVYSTPGSYTVRLTVTGPGDTDSQARSHYIIVTSPSVQFSAANYTVSEAGSTAVIQVILNRSASQQVVVNYVTSNGTASAGSDYISNQGSLTFAAGEVSKNFTVLIQEDSFDETDESVNLTLSSPVNAILGMPSTAILTIIDNDNAVTPTFTPTPTPVTPTPKITYFPTHTPTPPLPTATFTPEVLPPTVNSVAYIPIVARQPTPTLIFTPQPTWQLIGQAGLVANALAINNRQLFVGERKTGTSPGGLYQRSLENCIASSAFTRINTVNNSSILGVVFQGNQGVAASYDTNSIFYSNNDGNQWILSSQSITRPRTVAIAGGNVFYIGSEDAGIFRTNDGGKNWQNVATTPSQINVVKLDTGTLWIGSQNGVWKFTIGGEPQLVEGLTDSASQQVRDIAFGSTTEIYIATFNGVYRGDGANAWQPFGLQGKSLYSLELKDNTLYAGLNDGMVWRRNLNGGDWESLGGGLQQPVRDSLYDDTYCKGLLAATENGIWLYR